MVHVGIASPVYTLSCGDGEMISGDGVGTRNDHPKV